jgi:hypothetical protein
MTVPTLTFPLQTALDYAARGPWPIVPMWWPINGRCACGASRCNPAKHPIQIIAPHGVYSATTDRETILGWFKRYPHMNIGLACGALSKVVVLDVDVRNGGNESLDALIAEHGPLPPGPTVRTGGGGRHFYFNFDGAPLPSKLGPGLDMLSDGDIATLPYSEHASGGRYRWEIPPW